MGNDLNSECVVRMVHHRAISYSHTQPFASFTLNFTWIPKPLRWTELQRATGPSTAISNDPTDHIVSSNAGLDGHFITRLLAPKRCCYRTYSVEAKNITDSNSESLHLGLHVNKEPHHLILLPKQSWLPHLIPQLLLSVLLMPRPLKLNKLHQRNSEDSCVHTCSVTDVDVDKVERSLQQLADFYSTVLMRERRTEIHSVLLERQQLVDL